MEMVGGASNLKNRTKARLEGLPYMSMVLHGETHLAVTCNTQWSPESRLL